MGEETVYPHTQGRCTKRRAISVPSLGNETEEKNQGSTCLQMEGQIKCLWKTARTWTQLHGKIFTHGHMVLHQNYSDTFSHREIAKKQVNLVMAYPQAPIEHGLYLKFPKGIEKKKVNGNTQVLKLIRYRYGQKQAM